VGKRFLGKKKTPSPKQEQHMQDQREKGFCESLHIKIYQNVKLHRFGVSDSIKRNPLSVKL